MKILIPTMLRKVTDEKDEVEFSGETVQKVINEMLKSFPRLEERLFKNGIPNTFVNFYVNDEDIRFLDGVNTKVKDSDVLSIVPSMSGG